MFWAAVAGAAVRACGKRVVIDGIADILALPENDAFCLNVHQSWKTEHIPEQYTELAETWRSESVRNVLWTDRGNLELVEHYYPAWTSHYATLLNLPKHSGGAVMASDWARLLYLHKFGGLYVDLDYEAHIPPTDWPVVTENKVWGAGAAENPNFPIYFVNSPFLITEVMQNSLMYAPLPGHPFFLKVGDSIANTLDFIENPYCPDDHAFPNDVHHAVSANCPLTGAFSNRWTKSVTWLMKTEQITGPPVLDKTYTQLALEKSPIIAHVRPLSTADYFGTVGSNSIGPGKLATHWHANSWVTFNPVRLMPSLTLLIVSALAATLAAFYCLGKHERVCRSKCSRTPRKEVHHGI